MVGCLFDFSSSAFCSGVRSGSVITSGIFRLGGWLIRSGLPLIVLDLGLNLAGAVRLANEDFLLAVEFV